jgi:hypothetical protein
MDELPPANDAARKLAIVQGAMTAGPILLLPTALMVGPVFKESGQLELASTLFWVAFGMAFGVVPLAFLLYRTYTRRIDAAQDTLARYIAVNGRTIVLTALFEAPALFAGVIIMLAGSDWRALPALAAPLMAFAVLFPKSRWFSGEAETRLQRYS